MAGASIRGSGEIQGGAVVYPDLVPKEGGTAAGETVLATVFEPEARFAARVFQSLGGESDRVVACGDLERLQ